MAKKSTLSKIKDSVLGFTKKKKKQMEKQAGKTTTANTPGSVIGLSNTISNRAKMLKEISEY